MLSILRGLTAAISSNVSSLKRQAKRLQKAGPDVFGHQITLDQAQEAIAKANGFFRWSEVSDISIRAGLDKTTPFWKIKGRNDAHSSVLSALLATEVELNENGPVVILGKSDDAALPATCLFAEAISHDSIPGAIFIDTKAETFQDTAIGRAVEQLGLSEQISMFRMLDLRQKTIPVSIHAEPRVWTWCLQYILSCDVAERFERSSARHLFEQLLTACGKESRWLSKTETDLPFSIVNKAGLYLKHPELIESALLPFLSEQEQVALRGDLSKYINCGLPADAVTAVVSSIESLSSRNFDLGVSLWHESERRPVIVLFDRDIPETEILASAIHGMFYWRFVSQRRIRPTLFFSDVERESLPRFISSGSQSIIVERSYSANDEMWSKSSMSRAMFGNVEGGFLTYSGRRLSLRDTG